MTSRFHPVAVEHCPSYFISNSLSLVCNAADWAFFHSDIISLFILLLFFLLKKMSDVPQRNGIWSGQCNFRAITFLRFGTHSAYNRSPNVNAKYFPWCIILDLMWFSHRYSSAHVILYYISRFRYFFYSVAQFFPFSGEGGLSLQSFYFIVAWKSVIRPMQRHLYYATRHAAGYNIAESVEIIHLGCRVQPGDLCAS